MKKYLLIAALVAAVSGCKTTEPHYYHGEYSSVVYGYFKAEDLTLDDQINALEQIIQTAESVGKPVAPGVHAHLGMLYFESGDSGQGQFHFEIEKSLFPESVSYIDFLLNAAQGA